jgi:hypothetical protein
MSAAAAHMTEAGHGDFIAEMMKQEGPIVKVVRLLEDGTAEEHTVDMTPTKNLISARVGGQSTILGLSVCLWQSLTVSFYRTNIPRHSGLLFSVQVLGLNWTSYC